MIGDILINILIFISIILLIVLLWLRKYNALLYAKIALIVNMMLFGTAMLCIGAFSTYFLIATGNISQPTRDIKNINVDQAWKMIKQSDTDLANNSANKKTGELPKSADKLQNIDSTVTDNSKENANIDEQKPPDNTTADNAQQQPQTDNEVNTSKDTTPADEDSDVNINLFATTIAAYELINDHVPENANYTVQLGIFSNPVSAKIFADPINALGYQTKIHRTAGSNKRQWYAVTIGQYKEFIEANRLAEELDAKLIDSRPRAVLLLENPSKNEKDENKES